jgi:hypothetical protein
MLIDEQGRTAISNLGWVDHGDLWVFRGDTKKVESVKLGESKYAALVPGRKNHFSAVQHFDGTSVEISVHHFDDPAHALATARIGADGSSVRGNVESWEHVQKYYTAYFLRPPIADSVLLRVLPAKGRIEVQQLGWYNQGYDKGYQGVIGVTEVPESELLLFAVQRSSELVVYNPDSQQKVRSIQLAGRGGNPAPFYRRHVSELWSDDYDTLVKIDAKSGVAVDSRLIQSGVGAGRQFMGKFAFDSAETVCMVARPFSGDALGLDPTTLNIKYRCALGGQPLEAVVLSDNSIVGRDWKSGSLLEGRLAPV